MQVPLVCPESNWKPRPLHELPSWRAAKHVTFDLETKDTYFDELGPGYVGRDGHVIGYSVKLDAQRGFYVPIRHEGGGNVDTDQGLAYLRDNAKEFDGAIIGANLKYDFGWARREKVTFPKISRIHDVLLAAPILDDTHFKYNLDIVAKRLGLSGKNEGVLREAAEAFGIDPKSEMYKLHSKYVGAYGDADVDVPYEVFQAQAPLIEANRLTQVYDLECEILPAILDMTLRGVAVSWDQLYRVQAFLQGRLTETLRELEHVSGVAIAQTDLYKRENGPIIRVLEASGVVLPLTATGKKSAKRDFLEAHPSKVAQLITKARGYWKPLSDFIPSIRNHQIDGRIHAGFHQLVGTKERGKEAGKKNQGPRPGRMSSSNPNIQQQPVRNKEFGMMWRMIFVPDEPGSWVKCDYSSQEPRWGVQLAEQLGIKGAKEMGDRYRADPSMRIYKFMSELAGISDGDAKTIVLGLSYGMGGAKLCRDLGLPTRKFTGRDGHEYDTAGPEGKRLLDKFNRGVPYIKSVFEYCERSAAKHGYIRTVLGRMCRFEKKFSKYQKTRNAYDYRLQGSSADQMKRAFRNATRAGFPIQLLVHDEMNFTGTTQQGEELAEIMRTAVPCSVPHHVVPEAGPSWGEVRKCG